MIHQHDHRHSSVTVNEENLHNAALSDNLSDHDKEDSNRFPIPQYWVMESDLRAVQGDAGFKRWLKTQTKTSRQTNYF